MKIEKEFDQEFDYYNIVIAKTDHDEWNAEQVIDNLLYWIEVAMNCPAEEHVAKQHIQCIVDKASSTKIFSKYPL